MEVPRKQEKPGNKKHKMEQEHRWLNEEWMAKYFFTCDRGKCLFVLDKIIAVNKEYNFNRHFKTKHADNVVDLIGESRKPTITDLLKNLKYEQKTFFKCNVLSESATRASYRVSQLIASSGQPFTDGEFVKDCLL